MNTEYWMAMGQKRVALIRECRSVLARVGGEFVRALKAAELTQTSGLGVHGVQVHVSGSQGNCLWRLPDNRSYQTEFLPDEWVLNIAGGLPGIVSDFTAFLKRLETQADDALKEANKVL